MNKSIWGDRDFFRGALAIGLPVALQNLLSTTSSMIDAVMIGSQGELSVAAVGLCASFSSLLFSAYFGFCSGGQVFMSQYWGVRNEKGICRVFGLMTSCMMFCGLLFGALAVAAPEFIMGIYTDKVSIQAIGIRYLRIVGISYPLQVMTMAISAMLRSTENVKVPLYASVASLATNAFLNWVLIFGHFGFPRLGVDGAAIATVCAGFVNLIVLYVYCVRQKGSFLLRIRDHFKWDLLFIKEFFQKSIFIVFNELLYGSGMLIINIIIGRQVETGIAALAIFRVIEGLIFAFFGGFASASSVMVGKNVGSGNHRQAYINAKRFALYCPAVSFLLCVALLPARTTMLSFFGLGGEALFFASNMLLIYLVAGTIRQCTYICNMIFRAGGESVYGTAVEIIGLFGLVIPAMLLGSFVLHLPFLVIFTLMFADEIFRLIIMLRYMNTGRWIKPVTQEGQETLTAFRESIRREHHEAILLKR
ncbi:MATE family efflux transporter [Clostridia bacterium]|nr:MATE family efflux transporter [Clostridia bacterium]